MMTITYRYFRSTHGIDRRFQSIVMPGCSDNENSMFCHRESDRPQRRYTSRDISGYSSANQKRNSSNSYVVPSQRWCLLAGSVSCNILRHTKTKKVSYRKRISSRYWGVETWNQLSIHKQAREPVARHIFTSLTLT